MERSLDFYHSFFGFEVVDSYENNGRMGWCWLRASSAELMLQQLSADQQIRLNPAIGQSCCCGIACLATLRAICVVLAGLSA